MTDRIDYGSVKRYLASALSSVIILTLVYSSVTRKLSSGQVDFQFICPDGQVKILEKCINDINSDV